MSKNFITRLSTSRLPNRLPFNFKNGELNVDITGFEPAYYAPPHILV